MPLWTIRYEFICYMLVPFVVVAAARMGRAAVLALYLLALGWHASQGRQIMELSINYFLIGSPEVWPRFLTYFLGGMVFAQYREKIPYRWWLFVIALCALVITAIVGQFHLALSTAGIYVVFHLAYARIPSLHKVGRRHDLSYGTYLYGWPVQALLAMYFSDTLGVWALALLSVVGALLIAALSWRFVEEPFLREKARLLGHRAQPLQPQPQPPQPTRQAPLEAEPVTATGATFVHG
jgi:peptidoglycan/LPS O-acetylase OafA/YrhL